MTEDHEELLHDALETADVGDYDFESDNYFGNQNQYKPKSEEEYANIDTKMVSSLMD